MGTARERDEFYRQRKDRVIQAVPDQWMGTALIAKQVPWGVRTVRRILQEHAEVHGVCLRVDYTGQFLWKKEVGE